MRNAAVSSAIYRVATDPRVLAKLEFRPRGKPRVWRTAERPNPTKLRTKQAGPANLIGTFVMGLKTGFGPDETFAAEAVRAEIMRHFPKGGTMLVTFGWYQGKPEDSIKVDIENKDTGLRDDEFAERFDAMLNEFVKKYRQNEIWYDLYVGSEHLYAFEVTP